MAKDSANAGMPSEFIAGLGRLLMALVAGEDLRVRQVIARAVTRARPDRGLDLKARWHARHDLAADPRVE
jgi:hypothetical protein